MRLRGTRRVGSRRTLTLTAALGLAVAAAGVPVASSPPALARGDASHRAPAPVIAPSPARAGQPVVARGDLGVAGRRTVHLQLRASAEASWEQVGSGRSRSGDYRIVSREIRESHSAQFRVVAPAVRTDENRQPRVVSRVTHASFVEDLRGVLTVLSVDQSGAEATSTRGPVVSDDDLTTAIYGVAPDDESSYTWYLERFDEGTRDPFAMTGIHAGCDMDSAGSRILYRARSTYDPKYWQGQMKVRDLATGVITDVPTEPETLADCGMLTSDGQTAVYDNIFPDPRVVVQDLTTDERQYAPPTTLNDDEYSQGGGQISADGRMVAYTSLWNIGDEGWNYATNIAVWDRVTGTVQVLAKSRADGDLHTTLAGLAPSGRMVLLRREVEEPWRGHGQPDPRRYMVLDAVDLTTGTTTRIVDGTFRNQRQIGFGASISGNGRFVAYTSGRRDLTVGRDRHRDFDAFRYDLSTGETTRLTHGGAGGDGYGGHVFIWSDLSHDGTRLLVGSERALASSDSDALEDLYLWQDGP